MAFVEPVTLRDRGVRLEPLALEHEAGLAAAAADGELWKIRVTSVPEPQERTNGAWPNSPNAFSNWPISGPMT